jgi:hypothetical protein
MTVYEGEVAAVEESFCDIFGKMIQHSVEGYNRDRLYLYGKDAIIPSSANNEYLRSFENPKQYGSHVVTDWDCNNIQHGQPTTYNGENWYFGPCTDGSAHGNSGIMNHCFFILAEGKQGTNDLGMSYNVQGIGFSAAATIFTNAFLNYIEPRSTFMDVRNATLSAARNLYGANSNQYTQALNAWSAVGVGTLSPIISGPDNLCFSGKFEIVNLLPDFTVNWSCSNNNFTVSPSANNSAIISAKAYNASGTVIANIKHNGTTVLTLSKAITSCGLNIDGGDGDYEIVNTLTCASRRFSVPLVANATVSWEYPPAFFVKRQGNNYIVLSRGNELAGEYMIKATITDNTINNIIGVCQKDLTVYDLEGITLTQTNRWLCGSVKYGFRVNTHPAWIPLDDLCITWRNHDINSQGEQTSSSSAVIETGGHVEYAFTQVMCFSPVEEELVSSNFSQDTSGSVDPCYTFVPTDEPDWARVSLPTGNYKGTITCTVKSNCGATYSATLNICSPTVCVTSHSATAGDNSAETIFYNATSNPVSSILTLQRNDLPAEISTGDDIEIMLYSQTNQVRSKCVKLSEKTVQIDTAGLPNGLYTLVIVRNGEIMQSETINVKQ